MGADRDAHAGALRLHRDARWAPLLAACTRSPREAEQEIVGPCRERSGSHSTRPGRCCCANIEAVMGSNARRACPRLRRRGRRCRLPSRTISCRRGSEAMERRNVWSASSCRSNERPFSSKDLRKCRKKFGRVEAQRTVGRNKTRSPLSMEPSVTARQEFEIQNGYYACGINGCILAERHTGVCVMPELPNQTRVCVVVGCTTTVF